MRRTILFAITALLVAGSALAQRGAPPQAQPLEPGASQADVDKAVLAAPERLRTAAMVIQWSPADWSYETLRGGSNSVVCFDKSGLPGQLPFSVTCTHVDNLARAAQNMEIETTTDRAERQARVEALEVDGSREMPVYGSVWWHFQGQDQATAGRHHTIAVPGGTAESTGFPDSPTPGGVWLMNAGTSTAHLMIPGE